MSVVARPARLRRAAGAVGAAVWLPVAAAAELQRQQLLHLAEDVRAWRQRADKARQANASDLANRADQHLHGLMDQGRQLWNDLNDLGRHFNEVEQQLVELKTQQKTPSGSDLEKDWALFEAEQELRELRNNAGL